MKFLQMRNVLLFGISVVATCASVSALASEASDLPPEDLVFVTEDVARDEPGCDAVSAFHVPSGESEFLGDTHVSPGRMSANTDLSLVLATSNNHRRFVYALSRSSLDSRDWESSTIIGVSFSFFGGIAVLRSGKQFLVATSGTRLIDDGGANRPPHAVQKFAVPTRLRGEQGIGPSLGSFPVGGVALEILLDPHLPIAHILTEEPKLYSIDLETFTEVADPIDVPELIAPRSIIHSEPIEFYHATIDKSGRYLIVNGGSARHISVVDLTHRSAWALPVPVASDINFVGGVALNWADTNPDLLAVHGENKIVVFSLGEDARSMSELSRATIRPPRVGIESSYAGPKLSIAWSGSGSNIIAASDEGKSEFVILAQSAEETTVVGRITACSADTRNFANDILSSNGVIPISTPTPTPTPTSTALNTPLPSATITATRVPPTITAEPTPTSTATATKVPLPVFIPLALTESCDPTRVRADVALVLDASTSMTGEKLDAAKTSAIAFIKAMRLPDDRVGVASFNRDARVVHPLSGDADRLVAAIEAIDVDPGTRIDRGLAAGLDILADARTSADVTPVLVLLTDGIQEAEPKLPAEVAASARAAGIVVHVVGLGTDVDVGFLRDVADAEDRLHFSPSASELEAIYTEIARSIPCPAGAYWGRR